MKFTIKKKLKIEVDLKTLHVRAGVRYWKDAKVDGIEDAEGNLIPCREETFPDDWLPVIELETGKIRNWQQGKTAKIHYKVCDDGDYYLFSDDETKPVLSKSGYVPECLDINHDGYGDYIVMNVDENGIIKDWKFEKEYLKEFK